MVFWSSPMYSFIKEDLFSNHKAHWSQKLIFKFGPMYQCALQKDDIFYNKKTLWYPYLRKQDRHWKKRKKIKVELYVKPICNHLIRILESKRVLLIDYSYGLSSILASYRYWKSSFSLEFLRHSWMLYFRIKYFAIYRNYL